MVAHGESTTLPLVRQILMMVTLLLTLVAAGCSSEAPLSESCNQAYSVIRATKGEPERSFNAVDPDLRALADDLESIAEDGGEAAKDIFAPMVSALRRLDREGAQQGKNPDFVNAYEKFARDCGLPIR